MATTHNLTPTQLTDRSIVIRVTYDARVNHDDLIDTLTEVVASWDGVTDARIRKARVEDFSDKMPQW